MPEPHTSLRLNRPTARLAKPPLPHSRARHRPRCLAPHATPTPSHRRVSQSLRCPTAAPRRFPSPRKTSPPPPPHSHVPPLRPGTAAPRAPGAPHRPRRSAKPLPPHKLRPPPPRPAKLHLTTTSPTSPRPAKPMQNPRPAITFSITYSENGRCWGRSVKVKTLL